MQILFLEDDRPRARLERIPTADFAHENRGFFPEAFPFGALVVFEVKRFERMDIDEIAVDILKKHGARFDEHRCE